MFLFQRRKGPSFIIIPQPLGGGVDNQMFFVSVFFFYSFVNIFVFLEQLVTF